MTEPFDRKAVRKAIQNWFADSVGIERAHVIWADQGLPQPPYPYVDLTMLSGPTREGGEDDLITSTDLAAPPLAAPALITGQEITKSRTGPRQIVVQAQMQNKRANVIADSETDPNHLLGLAQSKLGQDSAKDLYFRASGLAVISEGNVVDTSLVVGTEWVTRATLDMTFRVTACVTEKTGYIETTKVDGTFTGTIADPSPYDFIDKDFGDVSP